MTEWQLRLHLWFNHIGSGHTKRGWERLMSRDLARLESIHKSWHQHHPEVHRDKWHP